MGSSMITTLVITTNTQPTTTTTTIMQHFTIYEMLTIPVTHTVTASVTQCPTQQPLMVTVQPELAVGSDIIVSWNPSYSSPGQLTLTGPSGIYAYKLNSNMMSQGTYDAGTLQNVDVGSWTVTLVVFGPSGCPPVAEGQTSFTVFMPVVPS
jgi:hypothetical protein